MTARLQLAIVGWPVGHSLSPALWEGMGARRGMVIEYGRYPITPGDDAAWSALWSSDLAGFNVTAPHKERAAERCATLGPLAARIGAVNTVVRRGGAWEGHSTDGYGFVRSLLASGERIRGRWMAILGTGGAGRAVACAALDAGADVALISRTPARDAPGCEACERLSWDALTHSGPFDIVVNATPLGRSGDDAPPLPYACCADALAVDLNYTPAATPFLRAARMAGARTLNGLGMLVYQACLGAALLLDGDPSAAEMYEEDFWATARQLPQWRS
ncbi:MAG: shikimate dehydrogenase [Gemmatimonadota bacterium]